jgi:hypothetical protein
VTVLAVDALAAAGAEPIKNTDIDTWNDGTSRLAKPSYKDL